MKKKRCNKELGGCGHVHLWGGGQNKGEGPKKRSWPSKFKGECVMKDNGCKCKEFVC